MIMAIVVIVVSDDTLLFGTNLDNRFLDAKYIIINSIFCLLLIRAFVKRIHISVNAFLIALTMILLVIISCALNNDFRLGYIYRCVLIMTGLLFTTMISFHDFARYYDKVMRVLAIASLIGFALFISFNTVLDLFPLILNFSHMEFYNLFLTVVPKYSGGFARNFGIFREPGVFQMFLIIGILFQMFVLKKPDTKVQILYIVALITTFSTTGYIALIFIGALYLIKRNNFKEEKKSKTIIIICLVLIFTYLSLFTDFIYKEEYGSVFGKLTNSNSSTVGARVASVVVNLKLFLNSPIWGLGVTNVDTQFAPLAQSILGVYTIHNTNTVFWQLAAYGAIFTLLWMYGIYKLCRRIGINRLDILFIFIIFNILFVGENLAYSLITNVLIFYGFSTTKVSKSLHKSE
jgi:hypothetical protein